MTDEKLAAALAGHSESAIAGVMERHSRRVYTVAAAVLRGIGSEEDAEEVAADTFVYLWEHPEKFDPRRDAVSLDETELADLLGVPELMQAQERRAALRAAVDALGEPDREILLRRFYYGQKPRRIAAALGLTVKQVENRLYQAKRRRSTSFRRFRATVLCSARSMRAAASWQSTRKTARTRS